MGWGGGGGGVDGVPMGVGVFMRLERHAFPAANVDLCCLSATQQYLLSVGNRQLCCLVRVGHAGYDTLD